jgi:hypothetical protein
MNIKALVAKFQNETQSNSVLDFITWLDCQEELRKEMDKQISYMRKR